jgi:hypothetical protein
MGADANHYFQIPILLEPVQNNGETVLYRSALDQHWNGEQWEDQAEFIALQHRLRAVIAGLTNDDEQPLIDLTCDLIRIGHDIIANDLSASGWITRTLMLRVLLSAAGLQNRIGHE